MPNMEKGPGVRSRRDGHKQITNARDYALRMHARARACVHARSCLCARACVRVCARMTQGGFHTCVSNNSMVLMRACLMHATIGNTNIKASTSRTQDAYMQG